MSIVYFLTGQGIDPDNTANSKFDINRTTGDIFVLKVSYYYNWIYAFNKYYIAMLYTTIHSLIKYVKRIYSCEQC